MSPKSKMNLATVRKMAAKKGSQIQFQIDVSNEEEWHKLLEKTGLIVVDVYSEWCGPCIAMVSSLKKLKLEIGSDYLHFAVAKSNAISVLQRFQNKSEPTWMFVAGGSLVNLMFGVDAPALIEMIKRELEKEIRVLKENEERKSIPFTEMTEAEKTREAIIMKNKEDKMKEQHEKLVKKKNALRERSLMKLSKMIPTHSCIIYFPHMISADGSCIIAQKMMYLNDSILAAVVDQIQVQLDATIIEEVFFKCPVFQNFNESLKKSLLMKPVLVTLLQTVVIMDDDSEGVTPRGSKTDYENQTIEQKLTKIVYGSEDPTESAYTEQSVAFEFIVEDENGEKLAPMWTPVHPLSKAAAIEVLFPRKVEAIGYVPEELPPSQILIIYDASKTSDIMELIREYQNEVYRVGFFTSVDPINTKLICKKYEQLCRLPEEQVKNAKLVVALKKNKTDDLLLEFSQVIPLYISLNEEIGTEESEQFFPFDYEDDEDDRKKYDEQQTVTNSTGEIVSDDDKENIY